MSWSGTTASAPGETVPSPRLHPQRKCRNRKCRMSFTPTSGAQRYCANCAKARKAEVDRRFHKKNRANRAAKDKAKRLAHPEIFRRYRKNAQEKDPDGFNRKKRQRHQAGIPKIALAQLELFRSNARREASNGIKEYVVCRECGAKLKRLSSGHLKAHRISVAAYSEKWTDQDSNPPPLISYASAQRHGAPSKPLSEDEVALLLSDEIPAAEAAKRAGIDFRRLIRWARFYGFEWRRRSKWYPTVAYVKQLRRYVRSAQPPITPGGIAAWHAKGMAGTDSAIFRGFDPYRRHLLEELQERPAWLETLASGRSPEPIFKMASCVYKRMNGATAANVEKAKNKGAQKGKPRKAVERTQDFLLSSRVNDLAPKCYEALAARRLAERQWPGDRRRSESAIRQEGFVNQADIDALMQARTAAGAAQRIVASRERLNIRTVQNACSAARKSS